MARLCGIWGQPYIDLTHFLDTSRLADVHDEVCMGLAQVEAGYTGGTLKWMGVVSPEVAKDPYVDAMLAIRKFTREEFARFVRLADDPDDFDLADHRSYTFGDETDHPLNRAQMLYLKYRHGVYFPWKVAYHFLENVWWEDKNSGAGKDFTDEAKELFPETVAFLRRLPFREVGRCVLFGLEANDHAPVHRDTEPGSKAEIEHCLSICPRGDKRFFLQDPERTTKVPVKGNVYWFNDMDWHGVEPDPFFRYSIRIDGVFEPRFLKELQRCVGR